MIFITGAARSGTSLTTAVLAKHGLNLGQVNSLNENLAAREGIVKPYLRSIGADPLCQTKLPEMEMVYESMNPKEWRKKITNAIGQAEPWGYKCAKAILFWPLWVEAFPDAKWVIVKRDTDSLLDCLERTPFMTGRQSREGWMDWIQTHLFREEELRKNADTISVFPRGFIDDPEAFRSVAEFCGFRFNHHAVTSSINRGLYK